MAEGGQVTLSGLASSDPDQSAGSLTYAWDFDYDGVTFDVNVAGSTRCSRLPDRWPATRTIAVRCGSGALRHRHATVSILNAHADGERRS